MEGYMALMIPIIALMIPLFHAWGTVATPREYASSAMRSVSVMPPQRVTCCTTIAIAKN